MFYGAKLFNIFAVWSKGGLHEKEINSNCNKSGKYVSTITGDIKCDYTDVYGDFLIGASLGAYTVEISKDGYITGFYNQVANDQEGMTFSLSPILDENEYRVVLTWGDTPSDLDSHLFWYNEYDQEMFHVYWANRTGYYNGEIVASLDVDDTSSYGPETVTITFDASMVENGGELRYCVFNFSRGNLGELSESNATVRVYKGNNLASTIIGSSRFDGLGDKGKILDIIEKHSKNFDLTIYDYEQKSRAEWLKEIRQKELEIKNVDFEKYYETVRKRKEEADKRFAENGHARY